MNVAGQRTTSEPDLLAGTPYRTLSVLGRGGMGIVVEAEHATLKKRVAIKLLRTNAKEAAFVERLRMEAQVLAQLESPHLVSVFDLGVTPGGDAYIVMERLVGRTLAAEVRERGPLPETEAVRLIREALRGIAVAHAAGIVHRDLKPDNLFLCSGGAHQHVVKVLDFGIAKLLDAGANDVQPVAPTAEGMLIGSPRYISPEQVKGERVDGRADVYAMGLVLFVLLTGRKPYEDVDEFVKLCQAQAFGPPLSPRAHVPVSQALEAVVLKALTKDRNLRFQSALELEEALEDVARGLATPRGGVPSRASREAAPADPPMHLAEPPAETADASASALTHVVIVIVLGILFFGAASATLLRIGGYL